MNELEKAQQESLERTIKELEAEKKYLTSSTEPSWITAVGDAITACNYRLKKKPIKKEVSYFEGRKIFRFLCPTCQKSIKGTVRENGSHLLDYCNVCGQGIDWSDEEKESEGK